MPDKKWRLYEFKGDDQTKVCRFPRAKETCKRDLLSKRDLISKRNLMALVFILN